MPVTPEFVATVQRYFEKANLEPGKSIASLTLAENLRADKPWIPIRSVLEGVQKLKEEGKLAWHGELKQATELYRAGELPDPPAPEAAPGQTQAGSQS